LGDLLKSESTPKLNWLDIAGIAPYPLLGEDAQEWVSRTRQEARPPGSMN
jgi:hypothetical protein